jgi:hypothetical protein
MKTKKPLLGRKKAGVAQVRRQEHAYGDQTTICVNGVCVLRKKAKCFGFEGCPGFKGR